PPVAVPSAPPPPAAPAEHAGFHLEGRSLVVVKSVLGLLFLLTLAFLGGHPRVRAAEKRVGGSRGMAAGLPVVLLGVLMRHPRVRVLEDSVLENLKPVLHLGLGWIGFIVGFRMDTRVFEKVSLGIKQLVLGRAFTAFAAIAGCCLACLDFFSGSKLPTL